MADNDTISKSFLKKLSEFLKKLSDQFFVKKQYYMEDNNNFKFQIPSLSNEIDMFATFFILLLSILIVLFITTIAWYVSYNKSEKQRRCMTKTGNSNRKIDVIAYDKDTGYALYDVNYDIEKKKMVTNCLCKEGQSANTFNFNAMRLSTGTVSNISKTCKCDGQYDHNDIYFKGNSGLVDFMYNKENTYVFGNPSME